MLVLLPFLALFLLVLICRTYEPLLRRAILMAAVTWGVLVTAITEILSLFHAFATGGVATSWALVIVAAAIWLQFLGRRSSKVGQPADHPPSFTSLPFSSVFMVGGIGAIAVSTAIIALVAAPNTWDSMTYHLSRVENWIQNQSVSHYPTHMIPQLQRTPWAEFAVSHLQLLSRGDHFANVIQWLSMVGSMLGTSLIARQLGATARGQLFASVVTATLPIGILEASSTQTDYAGTFWMVCFVSFLLSLVQSKRASTVLPSSVLCGASLGLAVLTKATTYFYAPFFGLWASVALWNRHRLHAWRPLLTIFAITLLLNIGHSWRNLDLFGSPLGPTADLCDRCGYTNERLSPAIFLSNVVRNVSLHLATPFFTVNAAEMNSIVTIHRYLGVDINDPRSTFPLFKFAVLPSTANENFDGNLLHLLLICSVIILLLFSRRFQAVPFIPPYTFCLIAAFLLFCLYLKWWTNHSRLHLALFVLWAPIIALAFDKLRSPRWMVAIATVLLLASIPWVVFNIYRPLVGERTIFNTDRFTQYFFRDPRVADSFKGAVAYVKEQGCARVGLVTGWDVWEYPLWVLLRDGSPAMQVHHVQVTNQSATLMNREPFRSFTPCATIVVEGGRVSVTTPQ